MNKGDLIEQVAKKLDTSKAQAANAVEAVLNPIKTSLKKGQKVQLVGFGSFQVKKRKERSGRNPATGQTIQIAAKKVPTFTAGAELKKLVN